MSVDSALQIEIQQSRPFVSHEEELMLAVLRTADLIRGAIAKALVPYGITTQQYNVLRILRGSGKRGMPTLSIGERMIERTPGVTRLLDRLEAHGWVERDRCQRDRRVVYAKITDSGIDLLDQIGTPFADPAKTLFPEIPGTDIKTLIGLLATLRHTDALSCRDPLDLSTGDDTKND